MPGPAPIPAVERANKKAEEGDFAAAADLFRLALDEEQRATLFESLAQCLMMLDGETEGAVDAARRACELDPEWTEGHLTLARASLNHGAFQQAVEHFRHVNPYVYACGMV